MVCVFVHFCSCVMFSCSPTVRRASRALMLCMFVVDSASERPHVVGGAVSCVLSSVFVFSVVVVVSVLW